MEFSAPKLIATKFGGLNEPISTQTVFVHDPPSPLKGRQSLRGRGAEGFGNMRILLSTMGMDGQRIKWPHVRAALYDVESYPYAKNLFGPETHKKFLEAARKLQ